MFIEEFCSLDIIRQLIVNDWENGKADNIVRRIESIYMKKFQEDIKVDKNDQRKFLSALYSIISEIEPEHILQTGTLYGFTSLCIALALNNNRKKGVLETIDPEPYFYGNDEKKNPVSYARKVLEDPEVRSRVIFHRGYSVKINDSSRNDLPDAPEDILMSFTNKKQTDFLIIDGDHSYEGVFLDLEVGFRTLRPNGPRLIFVHDYASIPEVKKAVRDWRNKHRGLTNFRVYNENCGFCLIQCHQGLLLE